MTERELKKLSRIELLKILIDQMTENESIRLENRWLKQQLEDRSLDINKCGSIAEAALTVNGYFLAADRAAKQYLDNAADKAERILKEARLEADNLLTQARLEAGRIKETARTEVKLTEVGEMP